MNAGMELWPIGNCHVSALVDEAGRFVWACVPRVDGDPLFSALVGGEMPEAGFWDIALDGVVRTQQRYLRNTPILVTRHEDDHGNAIEVTDFCPFYGHSGRTFRPVSYARIVRPVSGSPRITVRLRATRDWGAPSPGVVGGTSHIRYPGPAMTMRLTTTAPVGMVAE
ncbi:MAG TPA: DUF5911 domain-containing protein, partial [Novosphingobium sp.]|nr:DUF5911 domain-containing protein [Novosphingobium sp.]